MSYIPHFPTVPISHINESSCIDQNVVEGQFDDSPDDINVTTTSAYYDEEVQRQRHPTSPISVVVVNTPSSEEETPSVASIDCVPAPAYSSAPLDTSNIDSFSEYDVLCGRGGKTNNHPGNKEYRLLVDLHREEYFAARKPRKAEISQAIVRGIRSRGGRFLKRDGDKGTWYDVGDAKAVEKTSQALREGAAQKLRDILSSSSLPPTPVSPPTVGHTILQPTKDDLPLLPSFSEESHIASRDGQKQLDSYTHVRPPMHQKKRWLEGWEIDHAGDANSFHAKRMRLCPSA